MKFNKWTVALAAIGVVSLASAARADEAAPKMSAVQTALSSTTLSGYVDTAATWRPGTDQNVHAGQPGNVPAYSFAKNDGFTLNAIDIALDHPEDESPWAAGYHVELMWGPDAVPQSFNPLPPGIGASTVPIRQAYITLRTPVGNGIDWKIGVWDTIIGYESTSDPLNPNYTRSYGYTIEPTTHTGILATYKINDMVTVQAGIADGSNAGLQTTSAVNGTSAIESQKAYMGDIQFTAPDSAGFMKGATLTVGAIDTAGNGTTGPGATSLYAGMTLPTPVTALKLGWAFDYLDIHNGGAPGNSSDDSEWVVGVYGSFQATDKLSLNIRGEYLSSNGSGLYDVQTGPVNLQNPDNTAAEFTATVQYNLWVNVISRLEFRWDHAEHGNFFGANSATGAANRSNDVLLALNLIYQF
jgi:putative OmpL-like beta-barrel porin-2